MAETFRDRRDRQPRLISYLSKEVDNPFSNRISSPKCSEVRENFNSENLLAGSELSLL
jgi:hypothetical protein